MNRNFLTLGEQFNASDFCNNAKNPYIALARLAQAILGENPLLSGFTCTPHSPANMSVILSSGDVYQMAEIDSIAFGDLPIDSHHILKQGVNLDENTSLTFTDPATPGDSINYLIEISLQESDIAPENRKFFNLAPAVVNTQRADTAFIKVLSGTPAPTGTQTTPLPEIGFIGAFVVTVAYGQTEINSGNISIYDESNFILEKLQDKISQARGDIRYTQKTGIQAGSYTTGLDVGTENAYVTSLTPALTDYIAGTQVNIFIENANTGASTLNIDSLGAENITHTNGHALVGGELIAGMIAKFIYDGSNFQLLNPVVPLVENATIYRTADQTGITQGAFVKLSFDTVQSDNDSLFSSSDHGFIIKNPGRYFISARGKYRVDSGTVNNCELGLFINGAEEASLSQDSFTGSTDATLSGSAIVTCSKDDVLDIRVNVAGASPDIRLLGGLVGGAFDIFYLSAT